MNRPIALSLHTPGPGINAYSLKEKIDACGYVNAQVDNRILKVVVDRQVIQDTNELFIEGTIVGEERATT